MGTKIVRIPVDDLDGTEGEDVRRVEFSLDGIAYSLDLSPKNREALAKALGPYTAKAEELGNRVDQSYSAKDVRDWAAAQGIEVNGHGRLPNELVQSYLDARTR